MKTDVAQILIKFRKTLLTKTAAAQSEEIATVGLGMYFAAQDFERAAEVLVTENSEMRALFSQTSHIVNDEGLAARLHEAATSHDTSLRISALNRTNDELNALLIVFHTYIENQPGSEARDLELRVLEYLKQAVERRQLEMPTS